MLLEEGDRREGGAVDLEGLVVEVEDDCLGLGLWGLGRCSGGFGIFEEIYRVGVMLIG